MINKIKSFIALEGFKKYFLNSSWLVGEKIVRLIAGLFVSIYVARYLGPTNYGVLNYTISFVALFAVIAPLGIDEILVSELLKFPGKRDLILGTAFWIKVFGGFVTIVIVCLTFLFRFNDYQTNIYIFIIVLCLLFQPFNVIDLFFQSQVKAKYAVQANIFNLVINSIIRLFLVFVKASLIWFVLISILDTCIVAIILISFYNNQRLKIFDWKYSYSIAKGMLKQSWPLIFTGIVILIYMRIDQIMIKSMMGFKAVGNFSAAVRLTELWYFIPMAIGSSFFPAIINGKNNSELLYYKRLSNLMTFMVVIALIVSIPTLFLSDFIIKIIYGFEFKSAAKVLTIYIWASVFVFLGVASGKWFIIEKLNKISLYRSIFGAISNVALNLVLIPKFGIIGAAFSTVICQFIQTYLSNLFFRKTRKLFILQTKSLFLIELIYFVYNFLFKKTYNNEVYKS